MHTIFYAYSSATSAFARTESHVKATTVTNTHCIPCHHTSAHVSSADAIQPCPLQQIRPLIRKGFRWDVENILKPLYVQRDGAFEVRMQAERKRGVTLSQMCGEWGVGRVERDPVERRGRMLKWGRMHPCALQCVLLTRRVASSGVAIGNASCGQWCEAERRGPRSTSLRTCTTASADAHTHQLSLDVS